MDLTIIADLLGSINPIVLGSVAGGTLLGGAALYIKKNKNKFLENTDSLAQSNDFKTLKTEDLEREFGSLTVQTKILDEDESLFFDKEQDSNLKEDNAFTQPSTNIVDEASVFDCFNKYDQAIEALKKAIEIETHDKEKVRLKILLSEYSNKKGKTSLDNILKEYPSFHTKFSFDSDNTISALMSSPVPKKDVEISTLPIQNEKEFDIFADLPILADNIPMNNVVPVPISIVESNISKVHMKIEDSEKTYALFEKHSDTINEEINIFNDLPSLDTHASLLLDQENQFDQFSWSSNKDTSIQDSTEEFLKELQKDADVVDQVNENEAIDDMSKFWKEFGSIVSDIQTEVSDKNNNSNNSIPELQEPSIPLFESQKQAVIPSAQEKTNEISFNVIQEEQQFPQFLEEALVPSKTTLVNEIPLDEKVKVAPIEKILVLNDIVKEINKVVVEPVVVKEEIKLAKPFKVWANWIVNIQGEQIFRNHFINLKNPWGTSLSAEELYMGINKLSRKTPDDKSYPWVLVSVFPLTKE